MTSIILPLAISGSVWQIVADTSPFGKFILVLLVGMSLVSWFIIFTKWRQFRESQGAAENFIHSFQKTHKMADCVGQAKTHQAAPVARVFLAGLTELGELREARNQGGAMQESVRPLNAEDYEIVEMTMERVSVEEISKLEAMVIFLATTSGAAPFMGLLGTVVGIMDSFWAIGLTGSASLAVVAPGIAEALLATIIGLAAAIPALIAYNWSNNKIKTINDRTGGFILEFIAKARKEDM